MKNNKTIIEIDKIKLNKEFQNLDLNYITFIEFYKLIQSRDYDLKDSDVDVYKEIKEVVTLIIETKNKIKFIKNNLKFNQN